MQNLKSPGKFDDISRVTVTDGDSIFATSTQRKRKGIRDSFLCFCSYTPVTSDTSFTTVIVLFSLLR